MQLILSEHKDTASNRFEDFSGMPMSATDIRNFEFYEYITGDQEKRLIIMDEELKSFMDFIDEEVSMDWRMGIERNPKVLLGKPVIRGTRIAVDLILDMLSSGWSEKNILDNYPQLKTDDIRACLGYAGVTLRNAFLIGGDCLPQ
jgi:uncharacterized protein (DUF433 family)